MTNASPDALNSQRSPIAEGLIFATLAYVLWGVMPVYLKALSDVSALEVLAHRIFWSVPFGAIIISLRNQWAEVFAALTDRRVLVMLALSALAIALNWLIYVWSVLNERVLEASLGYYINPLMYVATGVFIMGEKLRRMQIISVALATAGVLTLTFGAGVFPFVSLALALLFTAYGYIRKTTNVGAMPGLFVEVLLLAPVALIYAIWLMSAGKAAFLSGSLSTDGLLLLAGPFTVIPLVCFALGARRLKLSTIGFLQYIAPTMQFFFGLYYGEPFTLYHGVCFGLIWLALAIFSVDAVMANKKARANQAA
ncbi:EamA family transporter RarD [Hyphococcus flavus]|uniref:EamA family transporter RarD n=1 Tax=Hyphococcus flavus TaxID=1866326 RepID=A0AAE9ZCZ5_9PROT|nr:EamA family transporter RarD [Hyphococcus flavus]WDI32449.1 EamA family transporter RarD [Hyphococcus flavus]